MPARSDPDPAALAYQLLGDGRTLGFITNPVFRTTTSLAFQIPASMVRLFAESISLRKGILPFVDVSMVIRDTALHELMRYSWCPAAVTQVDSPALDLSGSRSLVFSAGLSVVENTQRNVANNTSSSSADNPGHSRVDAFGRYLFRLRIDGLESSACSAVSEVSAFSLTPGGTGNLDLTIVHEGTAEPFRNWLQSGNASKAGHLDYLTTALDVGLRINFSALRVRSVDPPLTTFSPTPAKVRLSYVGIRLAPA